MAVCWVQRVAAWSLPLGGWWTNIIIIFQHREDNSDFGCLLVRSGRFSLWTFSFISAKLYHPVSAMVVWNSKSHIARTSDIECGNKAECSCNVICELMIREVTHRDLYEWYDLRSGVSSSTTSPQEILNCQKTKIVLWCVEFDCVLFWLCCVSNIDHGTWCTSLQIAVICCTYNCILLFE